MIQIAHIVIGFKAMRFRLLLLFVLATTTFSYSQESLSGLLKVKGESTVIPYARLTLTETGQATISDDQGRFTFSLPGLYTKLHLAVIALGIDTVFEFTYSRNERKVFYITRRLFELPALEFKSLKADQIVARAIKSIPDNYFSSRRAYYSFYRQYQKVNGRYKNLIEAKPVLIIGPELKGKTLTAPIMGYAVENMRRSNFSWDISDMKISNGLPDLMAENPIYNLENSSLSKHFLFRCKVRLDSESNYNYYISYGCRYSSENHGIANAIEFHQGESHEVGRLIIDKRSFAFTYIERKAQRNKGYNYPNNDNFILPSRIFWSEFSSGYLAAEYFQEGEIWFTKSLRHTYTNDFFSSATKQYSITDVFEWNVDSVSKLVDESIVDKFYRKCNLEYQAYDYKAASWVNIPNSGSFPIDQVYLDIGNDLPIEEQFLKAGLKSDDLK